MGPPARRSRPCSASWWATLLPGRCASSTSAPTRHGSTLRSCVCAAARCVCAALLHNGRGLPLHQTTYAKPPTRVTTCADAPRHRPPPHVLRCPALCLQRTARRRSCGRAQPRNPALSRTHLFIPAARTTYRWTRNDALYQMHPFLRALVLPARRYLDNTSKVTCKQVLSSGKAAPSLYSGVRSTPD